MRATVVRASEIAAHPTHRMDAEYWISRHEREQMEQLFEPVGGRSNKVRCTVCGATGYDVPRGPRSWKNAHKRGHSPCPRCGKPLSLLLNGSPRTHGRCPLKDVAPESLATTEGENNGVAQTSAPHGEGSGGKSAGQAG